jgi:dipeptidase E
MKIICSIWWGEIGGFFDGKERPVETEAIDCELITLSWKKSPKVLFLPTASWDSKGYISNFTNYYTSLGCEVDTLLLHDKFVDPTILKKKILSTDLIYVGGGNTLKMMKLRKKVWLIPLLQQAHKKEIILSGLSAGGICWLHGGMSNSRQFSNKDAGFIIVKGLDFAPFYFCPHFDRDVKRKEFLPDFIKKTNKKRIILEDGTAFFVKWKQWKIVKSKPEARAYLGFHNRGEIIYSDLKTADFQSLSIFS